MDNIECILLDIGSFAFDCVGNLETHRDLEGTICPISFVKDTLVGRFRIAHISLDSLCFGQAADVRITEHCSFRML